MIQIFMFEERVLAKTMLRRDGFFQYEKFSEQLKIRLTASIGQSEEQTSQGRETVKRKGINRRSNIIEGETHFPFLQRYYNRR